jgi:hypothetical protein
LFGGFVDLSEVIGGRSPNFGLAPEILPLWDLGLRNMFNTKHCIFLWSKINKLKASGTLSQSPSNHILTVIRLMIVVAVADMRKELWRLYGERRGLGLCGHCGRAICCWIGRGSWALASSAVMVVSSIGGVESWSKKFLIWPITSAEESRCEIHHTSSCVLRSEFQPVRDSHWASMYCTYP